MFSPIYKATDRYSLIKSWVVIAPSTRHFLFVEEMISPHGIVHKFVAVWALDAVRYVLNGDITIAVYIILPEYYLYRSQMACPILHGCHNVILIRFLCGNFAYSN